MVNLLAILEHFTGVKVLLNTLNNGRTNASIIAKSIGLSVRNIVNFRIFFGLKMNFNKIIFFNFNLYFRWN